MGDLEVKHVRIITKEQLLKEPSGTVYTYYTPDTTDGSLYIKVGNNCNLDLTPTFEFGTEEDTRRATNWSTDDLNIQADYDKNDLFAVFSKTEVKKMIDCLAWALSGCDASFNMDEVFYESGIITHDPEWMPD